MNAKDVAVEGDITTARFFARAFCKAGGITRETVALAVALLDHPIGYWHPSKQQSVDAVMQFLTDLLDIGEVE